MSPQIDPLRTLSTHVTLSFRRPCGPRPPKPHKVTVLPIWDGFGMHLGSILIDFEHNFHGFWYISWSTLGATQPKKRQHHDTTNNETTTRNNDDEITTTKQRCDERGNHNTHFYPFGMDFESISNKGGNTSSHSVNQWAVLLLFRIRATRHCLYAFKARSENKGGNISSHSINHWAVLLDSADPLRTTVERVIVSLRSSSSR